MMNPQGLASQGLESNTVQGSGTDRSLKHDSAELVVVAKRVREWTHPRCWAWRDGYRLKVPDALKCPEYG